MGGVGGQSGPGGRAHGLRGHAPGRRRREGGGGARYRDYLADGLANYINIFQPEVIALGGGVSGARDEDLLLPLREMVLEMCFGREADRHTRLVKAKLGNDAGIIGAALLGLER